VLASNAEQERLIEALLTLASSQAGPGQREPLSLAAITSHALAGPRPAISRLGLHVHADLQPAILDGDPLLVQQLVTNLIDNAARHNTPGGDIHVATGTTSGGLLLAHHLQQPRAHRERQASSSARVLGWLRPASYRPPVGVCGRA